jgi:hypothetical protein
LITYATLRIKKTSSIIAMAKSADAFGRDKIKFLITNPANFFASAAIRNYSPCLPTDLAGYS